MNLLHRKAEISPSAWLAQLDLGFSYRRDKTVLSTKSQRGPLTVQRAFYPEGDVCHLYILHPPGGVVGGDSLTINTTVKANASALLTTPGATKFYRSQGETAYQNQSLTVAENASLEWLPQENIYFSGAQVQMRTDIDLADNASLIAWETHCFGMPTNNEAFAEGTLCLDFFLKRNGIPLLMEKMQVNADRVSSVTGLRGHSVMGLLVATAADNDVLDKVRELLIDDDGHLISATLIDECLVVRYLGCSTASCRQLFILIWQRIRPFVLDREACLPRIWAT
ncbi:MAG: urease accessory protein [Gammaproteobacteria bacterium]|nr:MAG: urease accessory protein [Gammaproteobacteria bacterium]